MLSALIGEEVSLWRWQWWSWHTAGSHEEAAQLRLQFVPNFTHLGVEKKRKHPWPSSHCILFQQHFQSTPKHNSDLLKYFVDPDCPFLTSVIMQLSEHAWNGDFPYFGQIPSLREGRKAEGEKTFFNIMNARKSLCGECWRSHLGVNKRIQSKTKEVAPCHVISV